MVRRKGLILRVVLDCICYIAAVAVPGVLNFSGQPFHRGFFCDDQSIQHPYKPDTVSTVVLAVSVLVIPISIIVLVEGLLYWRMRESSAYRERAEALRVQPLLYHVYLYVGTLLFMLAINQTLTDVIKYSIGRLRPHFLSVCKPHYASFNCTSGFITTDVCGGTDESTIKQARLSFVSGHASVATSTAVFLILYLQARMYYQPTALLRPLLQTVLAVLALFVCCSRVSDYKHHWSDVLAGGLLGVLVSLLTCWRLAGMLGKRPPVRTAHSSTDLELHDSRQQI